jgi:hypothetical protein
LGNPAFSATAIVRKGTILSKTIQSYDFLFRVLGMTRDFDDLGDGDCVKRPYFERNNSAKRVRYLSRGDCWRPHSLFCLSSTRSATFPLAFGRALLVRSTEDRRKRGESMGRPRGALIDKNLSVGLEGHGCRYGDIVIVPVWRMFPRMVEQPIFWIAYDDLHIEDRVARAETDEQSLFVSRARREAGARVTAIPNGGFREENTAIRMKSEGMTTGFPDMIVWGGVALGREDEWEKAREGRLKDPRWDVPFDGALEKPLAIEMKKRNGFLKDIRVEQLSLLEQLARQGWPSCVTFGCNAALVWMRHCGLYAPAIPPNPPRT